MPPPVLGVLGLGIGVAGLVGSSKAAEQSEAAYEASLEEKIRAYEFNIGQKKEEIGQLRYKGGETRADIRREGEQFMRGQAATIGASGAEIGVGSPLMTMTETAESIERDIIRTQRLEEMEIKKRRQEIKFMKGEIKELTPATATGPTAFKQG